MKSLMTIVFIGLFAAGCVTTKPPVTSTNEPLYVQEYYDLLDAYTQLQEFKTNPHFHRLGFEGASPFNVWYQNLRKQSAETATLDMDHAGSRALTMLGIAYLSSQGEETPATEMLTTQFEASLEKLKFRREQLATLLFTGNTQGTLTPVISCCKIEGGLAARVTYLEEVKTREPNILLLDTGSAVLSRGNERQEVNALIFDAMNRLGYNAMGLGPNELLLPPQELSALFTQAQFPIVATNARAKGQDLHHLSPFELLDIDGRRIAVFSVQPQPTAGYPAESAVEILDPAKTLREHLDTLAAKVDAIIVMSHLSRADNRLFLEEFPEIDILITELYDPIPRNILGTSIRGVSVGMFQFMTKDGKVIPARKETLSLHMADSYSDPDIREKIENLLVK
jgi:2',3'-cyclic-nucleotide 2'-phosphodiesterase (5'-nucleotidase family)